MTIIKKIILKIILKIKNILKNIENDLSETEKATPKKEVNQKNADKKTFEDCLEELDFRSEDYFQNILKNYDSAKKTILIIDDSEGMVSVFLDYLNMYASKNSIDLTQYNILTFYGEYTPFLLMRFIYKYNIKKIDIAIIDIILPGRIRCDDTTYKRDGIDISIFINKKCNCNNFIFYTGNAVTKDISFIKDKIDKFKGYFGYDIFEKILYKDENDEIVEKKLSKLFKGI